MHETNSSFALHDLASPARAPLVCCAHMDPVPVLKRGIGFRDLHTTQSSLEDIFVSLVGDEHRSAA